MNASASDVAKYILSEYGDKTGFQLQKILYYCQAWHAVSLGRPLFDESLKAWEHGPVVGEVARQHRRQVRVKESDITGSEDNVSPESRIVIDAVLDSYGHLSGDELERLTHSERPWRESFNGYSGAAAAPIPLDCVVGYYAALSAMSGEVKKKHCVPSIPDANKVYVTENDFDLIVKLLSED